MEGTPFIANGQSRKQVQTGGPVEAIARRFYFKQQRFQPSLLQKLEGPLFCDCVVFAGEVGLLGLARMTIAEYSEQRVGRAGSLVEVELAHAANRVNYNQVGASF